MPSFPTESDLFPAGALAPATAKTKWQQFFQAVTALLGTSGTAADALTALGALAKAGDTLTGLLKFKSGTDIASAATVNLSTATGNTVKITGTTPISAVTMTAGQVMDVIFSAAVQLTHHATNHNLPGAANITVDAGARGRYYFDGTTVYLLSLQRADGRSVIQSVLGAAQNTISGTAIDFTGIPSWAKRVTVNLNGISTNGSAHYLLQLGSGSAQTTGYASASVSTPNGAPSALNNTTGFLVYNADGAAQITSGSITLTLVSGNTWIASGVLGQENATRVYTLAGKVTLSGALDRVRLTTSNGTDAFDLGSANLIYD